MPDPATPNASPQREPWPCGPQDPSCPSHPYALACGHEQETQTHRHTQEAWYPQSQVASPPHRKTSVFTPTSCFSDFEGTPRDGHWSAHPEMHLQVRTRGLGRWRLPLWNWGHLTWTKGQMGRGMAAFLAGTRLRWDTQPWPLPWGHRRVRSQREELHLGISQLRICLRSTPRWPGPLPPFPKPSHQMPGSLAKRHPTVPTGGAGRRVVGSGAQQIPRRGWRSFLTALEAASPGPRFARGPSPPPGRGVPSPRPTWLSLSPPVSSPPLLVKTPGRLD